LTVVHVRTPALEIDCTDDGDGAVVLLLHGWPDAARGWRAVRTGLLDAGYRVVAPNLRGFGATRFRDAATVRDGSAPALTQDALDLLDVLDVSRCAVVGHDWGARVAYSLAAFAPERLSSITALALAYQPRGQFAMPATFHESRLFWYQWFMYLDAGAAAISEDPIGFAREQWDTWSPSGWYDEEEFTATAEAFLNPDWVPITLSAYRCRFLPDEPLSPRYEPIRHRVADTSRLSVPTLMLHGGADMCDPPETSEGLTDYFEALRRVVIDGAGHFPHRESPRAVLNELLPHLTEHP
jgi:pimeloyl-ACP methyl ester carboxylesterase